MKTETENKKSLPFFGIGRLLPFLKKYRMRFVGMIVFGLCGSAVDILIPLLQRYALDHFVAQNTLDTLVWFILLYIAAVVFAGLVNYIAFSLAFRTEVNVNRDLRNAAFKHLQMLSFSYFNQNSVGYIHARVMSDTSRIGSLVSWTMVDGVWQASYFIGAIVVMFAVNAKLAALVVVIVPLIVVLFSIFQKLLIRANREVRELNSHITGDFNEGITGAKTIKTLVIEDDMGEKFVEDTKKMRSKSVHAARLRGLFAATMNLASSVALAVVLWRGGYIAASEVGTFSMFMSYAQGMMEPVRWIIDAISDLITTQVNIERLTNLLAVRSDVTDSDEVVSVYGDVFEPKRENWEKMQGDIEFDDVSFKYPDGDEYILEHFNLKIPHGSNIAIVGQTGAGKSTLVNLVCRFYEPTEGKILIDGADYRTRSQLWLQSNLGYVLQSPHLFSGTVADNIRYGRPDATDEEVAEAARMVGAEPFIRNMKDGYQADVGEGGNRLSTGQKQLISFARAILTNPSIFVLDEATSSVDTETEQLIQHAIQKVLAGRTSFIIAHRLSTIRSADRILVIQNGKITEDGTHQQLIAKQGYYYQLYTNQFQEEQGLEILDEAMARA